MTEKRDAARERWLKDRFAKIETHIEAKRAYNAAWAARQPEINALRESLRMLRQLFLKPYPP